MTLLSITWQIIRALPELIKLVDALQKNQQENQIQRKVADDVKTIHEAFTTKDFAKLNTLFNSP